jgi:sugar-specific transcriptional regulator TrmB/predicted DNA-binding transcriptional regulator
LSSEDVVPLLRQLGLNLYESEAYLALVTKGQISAKELGQLTSIPQSRTYDVLSSLKDKGFAMITPSVDKVYAPVEFGTILSLLYGRKKKEIQAEMIKVQEETEQRLDSLFGVYSQAKELLASLTSDHTQIVSRPVFVLEGHQNIEHAMLDMVDKAQSEFLRITKPPDSRRNVLDPFYFIAGPMLDHLERAKARGVKIRTLSLTYEIPSLIGLDYEGEEGNERKYLERDEDIPEKFVMVDGRTAILNLRDPVSKAFGSVGLLLESRSTCAIFGEHFWSMWNKAESSTDVTQKMKQAVGETIGLMKSAHFARSEIAIYRTLAKSGAMNTDLLAKSLVRSLSSAEVSLTVQKLLKRGILLQNDWLKAVMVENPHKLRSIIQGEVPEQILS